MTDIKSRTPLADALARADHVQNRPAEYDTGQELRTLRELTEAVRLSLGTFSEDDVRVLAAAAMELWNTADRPDENRILSAAQRRVLGKADAMFGTASA
jgi:hypothetical protein